MRNKKVLIIDDETDFGLLLRTYFTKRGFEVFLSHSLKEGMQLLDETNPDFLFLDNNLPDGTGWEATRVILENHPNVNLNLISAYRCEIPETLLSSSIHIWEKPLDLKKLNMQFA